MTYLNQHQYIRNSSPTLSGPQKFRCRFKDECSSVVYLNVRLTSITKEPTPHSHSPKIGNLEKTSRMNNLKKEISENLSSNILEKYRDSTVLNPVSSSERIVEPTKKLFITF